MLMPHDPDTQIHLAQESLKDGAGWQVGDISQVMARLYYDAAQAHALVAIAQLLDDLRIALQEKGQ